MLKFIINNFRTIKKVLAIFTLLVVVYFAIAFVKYNGFNDIPYSWFAFTFMIIAILMHFALYAFEKQTHQKAQEIKRNMNRYK